VVDDQRGGPTPADAIADACLDIAALGDGASWGTYHFCGAPPVTWYGFAAEILKDRPSIVLEPCTTAEFPRPAPRPANAVMDCSAIGAAFGIAQPDWRPYLAELLGGFGDAVEERS
jgi:dTDP-4-dehydrorhamnose reductase